MSLKTVYGPPPADTERIEAAEPEEECCIREKPEVSPEDGKAAVPAVRGEGRRMAATGDSG